MDKPSYLTDCCPESKSFPLDWKVARFRLGGGPDEGYCCPGCSRRFQGPLGFKQLYADHTKPRSIGGQTTWNNLRLLCWSCKSSKGDWAFQDEDREINDNFSPNITSILEDTCTDLFKIVFLAAEPTDQVRVAFDREVEAIRREILFSKYSRQIEFCTRLAVTANTLQRALLECRPHILHISGHGNQAGIYLLKDQTSGQSKLLEHSQLAKLLEILRDDLVLVVLNTCNSASFLNKVVRNIPFAIGMPADLTTDLAIEFSATFYRAIGFGQTLVTAYELAKTAQERPNKPAPCLNKRRR